MADLDPVYENIAAIAYEIGGSDRRQAAYARGLKDSVGFVGFHDVAIGAGRVLEQLATDFKVVWGETHDWLLATEYLADDILSYMINHGYAPTEQSGLPGLAQAALERAKEATTLNRWHREAP